MTPYERELARSTPELWEAYVKSGAFDLSFMLAERGPSVLSEQKDLKIDPTLVLIAIYLSIQKASYSYRFNIAVELSCEFVIGALALGIYPKAYDFVNSAVNPSLGGFSYLIDRLRVAIKSRLKSATNPEELEVAGKLLTQLDVGERSFKEQLTENWEKMKKKEEILNVVEFIFNLAKVVALAGIVFYAAFLIWNVLAK